VKTIAVYGMSANPEKAAHSVPVYLLSRGYDVIPINPRAGEIAGRKSFKGLGEIERRIDLLDVFRPSEEALAVVEEAVARRKERGDIDTIWLQLGIRNDRARVLAEQEGIRFVQHRCIYVEHRRLFGEDG